MSEDKTAQAVGRVRFKTLLASYASAYKSGDYEGAAHARDAVMEIFDAQRAAPAGLPEAVAGWKLVPVEPTREMLYAAVDVDAFKLGDISPLGFRCSPQQLFERCFRAMLAAAPIAPPDAQALERAAQAEDIDDVDRDQLRTTRRSVVAALNVVPWSAGIVMRAIERALAEIDAALTPTTSAAVAQPFPGPANVGMAEWFATPSPATPEVAEGAREPFWPTVTAVESGIARRGVWVQLAEGEEPVWHEFHAAARSDETPEPPSREETTQERARRVLGDPMKGISVEISTGLSFNSTSVVQASRDKFESWARPRFAIVGWGRAVGGEYFHQTLQALWECWQAAEAQRSDEREGEDAARYRALRDGAKVSVAIQGDCWLGVTVEIPGRRVEDFGDKLDAAIDAARSGT